jgi:murein DD-endopeptidase MepM/ murein hydrolase activator NlpD
MIYFNYYISVIIWQLINPFGFYQSLLQNFGQIISIFRWIYQKNSIEYIPMSLPFSGRWKVFNGGNDKHNSHSWNIISQRYAYDFVKTENGNKRFRNDKGSATSYFAFNQDVLAPNDGVIVTVQNNINDYKLAGLGKIDIWTKDIRGNFIIIKHDNNIYSFTAHLLKNSCLVKKGDVVKRGQKIAKCGNSGHSAEPHIHFQLQDKANWYFSLGLPIIFTNINKNDFEKNYADTTEPIYIAKEDIISNSNSSNHSLKKSKVEWTLSMDFFIPLFWSVINTLGILIGGGFIYYTFIKLFFRIGKFLLG